MNNVLMIQIHALFQLKGEKMSDSSHCLNWLYMFGLKTVLDSGFHSMDFGFQVLDSGFLGRGTWIPDPNRYWDSLSWFVDSKAQFSGLHKQIFPDSGFWNPDILTWCLKLWRPGHQKCQPEVDFFLSCALTSDSIARRTGSFKQDIELPVAILGVWNASVFVA